MKNLWSLLISAPNIQPNQKTGASFTTGRVLLLGAAVSTLVFINACSPELSSENMKSTADSNAAIQQHKQQNAADIEDSINNSYARLASNYVDICPKLLQKDADNNTIERKAEIMVDNHCDYFLYPHRGQSLAVEVDSSQIEALLIVPTLHNFANGDYKVASYDKHVIRLAYDGATYKPARLSYDVAITVGD